METISFDHAGLVKLYQQGYFDADAYLDKQTLLLVSGLSRSWTKELSLTHLRY